MSLRRGPGNFWLLLWVGATLALAAVLVLEDQLSHPKAGDDPGVPANVVEARLLPAFGLSQDQQTGAQTIERPLFVPDRRPAPPAQPVAVATFKKGQFVLQGTTIAGQLAIAMLKETSTGVVHRVERGGGIQGMTLAEISPEQVVLRSGGDSETLPLLVARGAGSAAVAVEQGPFAASAASRGAAVPGTPSGPSGARAPEGVAQPPVGRQPPSFGTTNASPIVGVGVLSAPLETISDSPPTAAMRPAEILARRRAAQQAQEAQQAQQPK